MCKIIENHLIKKFEILNNENFKNKFGLLKLSGRDSEQMNGFSS